MEIDHKIKDLLDNEKDTLWAVADITYSELSKDYSRAIILARKYYSLLTNDDYYEQDYHNLLLEMRRNVEQSIIQLQELFNRYSIKNKIPTPTQTDEKILIAPFSFKYAAVQAGLGWIGKSGVLITREFGPRVFLAAILVDYPLACGQPVMNGLCGGCTACVKACPGGFIKGNEWNISTKREQLLDFQQCNTRRSEYIRTNGRKHTCGYCILACPWGR